MPIPKLTEKQREEVIEKLRGGARNIDVAREYGLSNGTVTYYLKQAKKNAGNRTRLSEEQISKIPKLLKQGLTHQQIAGRFGVSSSAIYQRTLKMKTARPAREMRKIKSQDLTAQIAVLAKQGLNQREISEKLGLYKGAPSYYLRKHSAQDSHTGEAKNGTGINRNIGVGIAYAETERFIGVLAERLGIAPDILRSKLSELLGHSPFGRG